jgi:hypothetical protein
VLIDYDHHCSVLSLWQRYGVAPPVIASSSSAAAAAARHCGEDEDAVAGASCSPHASGIDTTGRSRPRQPPRLEEVAIRFPEVLADPRLGAWQVRLLARAHWRALLAQGSPSWQTGREAGAWWAWWGASSRQCSTDVHASTRARVHASTHTCIRALSAGGSGLT